MNNKQFRQKVAMAELQMKLEQAKRMNLSSTSSESKVFHKGKEEMTPQVVLMGILHLYFK